MVLRRLFRSPTVGNIADWWSLIQIALPFIGGGAFLTWAASSIDVVIQHGWGAAVFVGIGVLCLVTLVISVAAFAFRAIRPAAPSVIVPGSGAAALDDDIFDPAGSIKKEFAEKMQELSSIIQSLDRKTVFFSQVLGYLPSDIDAISFQPSSDRITELGRLDDIEQQIRKVIDRNRQIYDELSATIGVMRNDLVALNENHIGLKSKVKSILRAKSALALFDAEVERITELALKLSDPLTAPLRHQSWREWTSDLGNLKSQLGMLCRFAESYAPIHDKIFDIDPDLYKSQNWSFEFKGMSEDQKHDYKTFRIIMRNFEDQRSKASSAISSAAHASI